MTLKDWLFEQNVEPSAFAERIGRTTEAVRRYVNGARIPDRATMPLIVSETRGSVTANDFFGIDTVASADHGVVLTPTDITTSAGNTQLSSRMPA
ncbi:MAG: hypothetical protein EOP94_04860 [Zymomonas sp.]|nr:MAG: hypothetical protein EOP94_04860 [Zymomonas sp.]